MNHKITKEKKRKIQTSLKKTGKDTLIQKEKERVAKSMTTIQRRPIFSWVVRKTREKRKEREKKKTEKFKEWRRKPD